MNLLRQLCQFPHRHFVRNLNIFSLKSVTQPRTVESKRKENKFQGYFQSVDPSMKDKNAFLQIISKYKEEYPNREFLVEFIHAALENMHSFGVNKDYNVYKTIIYLYPPDSYLKCENVWMKEFQHYPKQQDAAISILHLMEYEGVAPESELGHYLIRVFGDWTYPVRKIRRMIYWFPKFKNANPYSVPLETSSNPITLASVLLERICIDPRTEINVCQNEENKEWFISAQSPSQRHIISQLSKTHSVSIEGPYLQWIRTTPMKYFILKVSNNDGIATDQNPPLVKDENDVRNLTHYMSQRKSIEPKRKDVEQHELSDGIICGICVPSSSNLDTLKSWLRYLEEKNSNLQQMSVIFRNAV